ncbi:RAMP superfamily CRISPR-associated protein [Oscillatoria salina]|uniref:RAMP superfamily CRISPR-associated protein n=1 Tax=Oscillatoria salina TaxID=331517 RepID=UPI001CCD4BC4|nr:RAMP superfamily CRISPR-associated protein [Oscillatoria salina]MBZ8181461.1 CRISPR-associated protein Csm3 [Oscillatoria salina IIICB1]
MIQLQNLLNRRAEISEITATIETALSVGAGGSSGSLADKPIVRTAAGKLLIPASQFKGRLRHECEKLARGLGWQVCQSPNPQTMCPQRANFSDPEKRQFHRREYQVSSEERYHCIICQIFGNPALPSRLIIDDLICEENPENLPEVLRPGVTINRRRRVAEDQKLYFLETSPANAKLKFKGTIVWQPQPGLDADIGKALVLAGLQHINALGGSKSVGLGWLKWDYQKDNWGIEKTTWQKLIPKNQNQ